MSTVSQSSVASTKRFTDPALTVPASASFQSLTLNGHLASTSPDSPQPISPRTDQQEVSVELKAIRCPPCSSLESNLKSGSSPGRPRAASASTWSPSLWRKLRWRLRQYTLWESFVLVAFVMATVVFFNALAGVGYVQNAPSSVQLSSGWRVPQVEVLQHGLPTQASTLGIVERFLAFAGLGRKNAATGDESEEMDSLIELGPSPRGTHHGAPTRQHLRFGTWQRIRQRMVSMHINTPDSKRPRVIHRRSPWKFSPPPSPDHESYHKRPEELSSSQKGSLDGRKDSESSVGSSEPRDGRKTEHPESSEEMADMTKDNQSSALDTDFVS